MRAWTLLLACGLRLHRWSNLAVAEVAAAGVRPARRRCPAVPPGSAAQRLLPVTRPLATALALCPSSPCARSHARGVVAAAWAPQPRCSR